MKCTNTTCPLAPSCDTSIKHISGFDGSTAVYHIPTPTTKGFVCSHYVTQPITTSSRPGVTTPTSVE